MTRTDFERPLHYEKILPFGAVDGGDILGRVDIRRFWEPILDIFPVIVGSVTPATLLSYDEKFRWNQYCDTMPISRAAVVAEKYVLTAATVLLLTTGSVAVQLMASGRTGKAPDDLGLIAALTFTVGLLPPCVMLPAVYKFGMEKGRIVYYFCIGAACAIPFALPSNALDGGMSTASVFLLPVIAAALFAVSWAISTAVYVKKSL